MVYNKPLVSESISALCVQQLDEKNLSGCYCSLHESKTGRKALLEISQRFMQCKLELHPKKTKIVYAVLDKTYELYPNQSFDYLGFTFRKKLVYSNKTNKGFVGVVPAISNAAKQEVRQTIRK